MKRTHLGVQALLVLTMVSFASWPQFRPVRAQSIWRYAPASVLQARTMDAARYAGTTAGPIQWRAATEIDLSQLTTSTQSPAFAAQNAPLEYTPGPIAVLGGKENALVGLARNSLNAPIPYARVVLRDIRSGEALEQTTADELGRFTFVDLQSSAYVVELLGPDGAVVAASAMVMMSKGQLLQTEVRVAAAAATVAATFSNEMSPTLQEVNTLATSSDVTRTTTTLTPRVTSTGN
jgi:hypothetical protein